MGRSRRTTTFGVAAAAAAAVAVAASALLLLLPGVQAFLLPSSSGSASGRITTAPHLHTTTAAATTRLYHSPGGAAAPQTDAAVPEAHRGLHTYLYGDEGAENAHASSSSGSNGGRGATYVQFTRGTVHPVEAWLGRYDSSQEQPKVAGVYGVYDDFEGLRFIGVSRDVGLALRAHLRVQGRKAVAGVAIQSFRFPKREEMANYQAMWLAELAALPEGNKEDGWAASIKDAVEAGAADQARRAAYESTKAKLRTAMADPTLLDELEDLDELDEDEDPEGAAAARREALRRAVGGTNSGDWSAEVDAQTRATISSSVKDSPFEGAKAAIAGGEEGTLELTPQNVDKVLDEVRPYLISDGGNIEVVRVEPEGRNIYLRLQGACGSCPSSTVTMKMGVERVLREKFAGLGLVEAVAPEADLSAPMSADGRPLTEQEALKQKLEAKLGEILPAIRGLGATASIQAVSADGVVSLSFTGPEKVRLGVVYALKAMPGVADVQAAAMTG